VGGAFGKILRQQEAGVARGEIEMILDRALDCPGLGTLAGVEPASKSKP